MIFLSSMIEYHTSFLWCGRCRLAYAKCWSWKLDTLAASFSLREPSLPMNLILDWLTVYCMVEQTAPVCCSPILEAIGPTLGFSHSCCTLLHHLLRQTPMLKLQMTNRHTDLSYCLALAYASTSSAWRMQRKGALLGCQLTTSSGFGHGLVGR